MQTTIIECDVCGKKCNISGGNYSIIVNRTHCKGYWELNFKYDGAIDLCPRCRVETYQRVILEAHQQLDKIRREVVVK